MICVCFLRVPFGSGVKGKGKPKKSVSNFLTFGVDVRLDPFRTSEETLADCPPMSLRSTHSMSGYSSGAEANRSYAGPCPGSEMDFAISEYPDHCFSVQTESTGSDLSVFPGLENF